MENYKIPENSLGREYLEHQVFSDISDLMVLYYKLSESSKPAVGLGFNIFLDEAFFDSIKDSLDSIQTILLKGRLNDAYALLRKYYDTAIINIYTDIYLYENFNLKFFNENIKSIEELDVKKISDWIRQEKELPWYQNLSKYINDSETLKPISSLLKENDKEGKYHEIRNRCNDQVHFNYYFTLLLNDDQINFKQRIEVLNQFHLDLIDIFILHFSFIIYRKGEYITDQDYFDAIEAGLISIYDESWASKIIIDVFQKMIKPNRPDIANLLIEKTGFDFNYSNIDE